MKILQITSVTIVLYLGRDPSATTAVYLLLKETVFNLT